MNLAFPSSLLSGPARLCLVACGLLCAGCSEMKFVNTTEKAAASSSDTGEDIRLTGMVADLTSGPLVQHRVKVATALLAMTGPRRTLTMDTVRVDSFDRDGSVQAVTSAKNGIVFMTDNPEAQHKRNDMVFEGDVRYRVPRKGDPTTDTLSVRSEKMQWENENQQFHCPTHFEKIMYSPNRPPFRVVGEEFTASRDLQTWRISHGGIGAGREGDIRGDNVRRSQETLARLSQLDQSLSEQSRPAELPVAPPTAEIPVPGGQPPPEVRPSPAATVPGGRRLAIIGSPGARNGASTSGTPTAAPKSPSSAETRP